MPLTRTSARLVAAAAPLLLALGLLGVPPTPAAIPTDSFDTPRARADEVSFFHDGTPKAVSKDRDRRPVEVGLQFRTAAAGSVTGAQVYKIARSKGATPRRASLWTARGKRLAAARITPRKGAGWVTVRFAEPVAVRAGRTYTVSVFAPKGRPAITERGLRKKKSVGPLRTGGKRPGVFRYGGTSRFPTRTWKRSNYWVDVTFLPSDDVDTSQPPLPEPQSGAWPDADNTGVPAGTALTPYTGPMTITVPGTVIDAKQVTGDLDVRAADVTISRTAVTGNVVVGGGGSLTISDTDIDAGDKEGTGLGDSNYTAVRVHVVGGNRSMYCADNCTIRDSYVHGQMTDETGYWHESGIRMEQNTTLIHNTIGCDAPPFPPDAGCSAGLTGYGDFAPVRDNLIQNNLFLPSTGGACAYGGSSGGKPYSDDAANIRFIDNVFSRGRNGKCGLFFPVTDFDRNAPGNVWSGNVWDNGGTVNPG